LGIEKSTITKYYRLQVTSKKGCGQLVTNAVRIKVYEPFKPASVSSAQQICFDGLADTIKVDQNPSGGNLAYTFNWNVSNDSINWTLLPGQNSKFYNIGRLRETTFYKLESISGQSCGSGFSNTIKIIVNPLPDTSIVIGNETTCRNKKDEIYELSKSSGQYSYNWSLKGGEVFSGANLTMAYINWFDNAMYDTIRVNQIDKITGCYNTMIKAVEVIDFRAPDKTTIIRKPNSNILVCEDASLGLNYLWGYTIKSSGLDSIIHNSNNRYVQLPHNFDSLKYRYWVETNQFECKTKSYLGPSPVPTKINELASSYDYLKLYPNPLLGNEIWIESNGKNLSNYRLFDMNGKNYQLDYDGSKLQVFGAPNGLLFLQFEIDGKLVTRKILKISL
jgi:hypothetical protein